MSGAYIKKALRFKYPMIFREKNASLISRKIGDQSPERRQQPLRENAGQRHAEFAGGLFAPVLGKEVDDPLDRLNGVGGMDGAEHPNARSMRC